MLAFKLTSRKLWIAIIGFFVALVGGEAGLDIPATAEKVLLLLPVVYVIVEGAVDAAARLGSKPDLQDLLDFFSDMGDDPDDGEEIDEPPSMPNQPSVFATVQAPPLSTGEPSKITLTRHGLSTP